MDESRSDLSVGSEFLLPYLADLMVGCGSLVCYSLCYLLYGKLNVRSLDLANFSSISFLKSILLLFLS